jgi:hypothetical protein
MESTMDGQDWKANDDSLSKKDRKRRDNIEIKKSRFSNPSNLAQKIVTPHTREGKGKRPVNAGRRGSSFCRILAFCSPFDNYHYTTEATVIDSSDRQVILNCYQG